MGVVLGRNPGRGQGKSPAITRGVRIRPPPCHRCVCVCVCVLARVQRVRMDARVHTHTHIYAYIHAYGHGSTDAHH